MRALAVSVRALRDVDGSGISYLARTETPWLRLDFKDEVPAGRWIRMTYATSFFDPLVRPVVRCILGTSHHDEILPAALFGRAVWLGFIPEATTEIWISPTNRPGPFSFRIEHVASVATGELLRACMWRHPGRCLTGIGAHLIGLRYTGTTEFHRALSATPLRNYPSWRKIRSRSLELTGIDAPREPWDKAPHVRFVLHGQGADAAAAERLIAQLRAQPYPHWTVVSGLDDKANEILNGLADADLIAPVTRDDEIPLYSVAVLAASARQQPISEVFYGDEEWRDRHRQGGQVRLRPDWSPILAEAMPSIGDVAFFRVGFLTRRIGAHFAADLAQIMAEPARYMSQAGAVTHIRRVMRTRFGRPALETVRTAGSARHAVPAPSVKAGQPCATIIIPTKNQARLLKICIDSLRGKSLRQDFEVIIVDNGSTQEEARNLLAGLANDMRFRVIHRPEPFNFAKFCNDAAAEARACTLVFLNNDTEVVAAHWLEPLIHWAGRSDIGAVGAKLLYPNGRVQHAGVVLGIDGRAGHFQRMVKNDDPGYFGRLCVPHEVSAVTGACLAVDKQKFEAVGGFDAVNLPIELNDIDLCLRLSERGWKTLCVPESLLLHHESASRGTSWRPDEIYDREHRYFRSRWMGRLRDDPYFHPALSLHSLAAALG